MTRHFRSVTRSAAAPHINSALDAGLPAYRRFQLPVGFGAAQCVADALWRSFEIAAPGQRWASISYRSAATLCGADAAALAGTSSRFLAGHAARRAHKRRVDDSITVSSHQRQRRVSISAAEDRRHGGARSSPSLHQQVDKQQARASLQASMGRDIDAAILGDDRASLQFPARAPPRRRRPITTRFCAPTRVARTIFDRAGCLYFVPPTARAAMASLAFTAAAAGARRRHQGHARHRRLPALSVAHRFDDLPAISPKMPTPPDAKRFSLHAVGNARIAPRRATRARPCARPPSISTSKRRRASPPKRVSMLAAHFRSPP